MRWLVGRMKNVLIVDDDQEWLYDTYEPILKSLGCSYELVGCYDADRTKFPTGKFDIALIDGLHGEWRKVVKKINASRVILNTFSDNYLDECRSGDYSGVEPLGKIGARGLIDLIEGR